MGTAGGRALEVVPPHEAVPPPDAGAASSQPPGSPRRRRPWLPAGVVVLVVAAGVALPVRSTVAVDELRGLARRWSWYEALERARTSLDARFVSAAMDPAEPEAVQGEADLAREELPLVLDARAAVRRGRHLPDAGLARLRGAMAAAFAARAAELAASAAAPGGGVDRGTVRAAAVAEDQVRARLATEAARWRQRPIEAVAPPALHAADGALARLARPTDSPLPVRLILVGSGSVTAVDLASGRPPASLAVHQGSDVLGGPALARGRYLTMAATGPFPDQAAVYALSPDLLAPPRVIGVSSLDVMVAAADPGGVWLQTGTDAVEVDGTGRVVRGPVPLGLGRILVGATDRALVTSGLVTGEPTAELQLVPLTGGDAAGTVVLTTRGQLVAASGGRLAWLETLAGGQVVLALADGAGGHVRTVVSAGLAPVGPGAISPDGTRLALRYQVADGPGTSLRLGLVDLTTGSAGLVTGRIGDRPTAPLSWSPTGDRVFFVEADAGSAPLVAMWATGATRAQVVRVSVPGISAVTPTAD